MVDGSDRRFDTAPQPVDHARTVLLSDGGRDLSDPADRLEAIADVLDHDLANHLTVAYGYLEAAHDGDPDDLAHVQAALERIEGLVDEVVYLARSGELVDEVTHVELQDAVETAWTAVPTDEAGLVVEDTTVVCAYRQALCHLLENLLHNAVVHAGPGVTVRVGTTAEGFYVEDDGPGIPPDRWQQVFESGRGYGHEGTGLGLTIVDRIAAAHDWTIRVEDGEMGGARFVVEDVSMP